MMMRNPRDVLLTCHMTSTRVQIEMMMVMMRRSSFITDK